MRIEGFQVRENEHMPNFYAKLSKAFYAGKSPIMPITTVGEYIDEFNLVQAGKSSLSSAQRNYVKHIVYLLASREEINLIHED